VEKPTPKWKKKKLLEFGSTVTAKTTVRPVRKKKTKIGAGEQEQKPTKVSSYRNGRKNEKRTPKRVRKKGKACQLLGENPKGPG